MSLENLRGELKHQEPLAGYTTWRVGGPADRFYSPADATDLANFMAQLPVEEPLLWLGLGSNLLVRDGGFRGTVITLRGALAEVEFLSRFRVQAGAGITCAKLARLLSRQRLTGAEFLGGIPGTLGGALAMNAGAFGSQTWDFVEEVTTIDRSGQLRTRTPEDFSVGYREVKPAGQPREEWFVAATLHLQQAKDESGQERIKALLERRSDTQPVGMATAGSTFRNPEGNYAAKLIEEAGLKGFSEGGACVSNMHANFILNTGNATALEIETLIQRIQSCVEEMQGVRLIPEVHMVGEPSLPIKVN
ncbi:UDP-N-acetylenolpyruvoylglucosamine reductase [Gammaproteobacteria bacterium]